MAGCRRCMSKTVVLGVNTFLGLLGLILLAAGGKLLAGVCNTTPSEMKTLSQGTVVGVMIAGGALFLCSLVGCAAVSKRTRFYAILYLGGLLLVYLAQAGATYFVFNESQAVRQLEAQDVDMDSLKSDMKDVEYDLAYDVATLFKNGECKGTAKEVTIDSGVKFTTAVECKQCPLLEAAFDAGCTGATDVEKDAKSIAKCTAQVLSNEGLSLNKEAVVSFCACKATVTREVRGHMDIVTGVCIGVLVLETMLLFSVCYLACTRREEVALVMGRRPLATNQARASEYPQV